MDSWGLGGLSVPYLELADSFGWIYADEVCTVKNVCQRRDTAVLGSKADTD